jgi:hypothetical protein
MRTCTIVTLNLLVLLLPAFAYKKESLDELIQRAEAAELKDQPKLFIEVAQRQLKAADRLYQQGQNQQARAAVQDVVSYSEKGTDAATKSGKRLKKTEIAVRKMAERLRDIKRTLDFAEQAPVQAAADNLEKMRTALLARMFGSKD